ncbi:MAG: 3-hydroxyacyl-CoA dehydrogenase NAD-binding domain-containing protein [Sphingomonadales bacterium]
MIKYEVDSDGIATLTIDMPDRSMNVFNEELIGQFEELVEKILADDAVKGAIITSGKAAFLAGADLSMLEGLSKVASTEPAEVVMREVGRMNRFLRRMETGGKPFAAAVNGLAMGGGLELALGCHYRVVADNPKIQLALPEVKVGMVPGAGGTQRLSRLMGIQAALQYLLEGKSMTPQQAQSFGVFHKIAPAGELVANAKAWLLEKGDAVQPWDKKGFKIPGGKVQSPAGVQTFIAGNAMLQSKTYHNYPAAEAIISCVYEGLQAPMDTALRIETRYVTSVLRDPTVGNMIRTLFVNKTAADKLVRRPEGVEKSTVEKLGVLGAGMMGAGIAWVSARAGMEVVLLDRELEFAEKGKGYAEGLAAKGVKRRKMTQDKADQILGRIKPGTDYADLDGCDLVIEAVFEDREIKADVTRKTEAVIADTAIFASNTSTLPITGLAEASARPDHFIGIHFFSPVEKMPLVEIIMGEKSSNEALAKSLDYVRQIRKTPIVVNDGRGFYTSRVFGTYVTEGLAMLAEGVAPALIENVGKMSGMPVGALAIADEVSIDLAYHIKEAAKKDLGDQFQVPPSEPVIDKMVLELKRPGKKAKMGFYAYPEGARKHLWPDLGKHFPVAGEQPDPAELRKRFLYIQAIETARCMEENVVTDAADADVGSIFGWAFAPFTGGPLSMIDTIGVADFVEECDRLAAQYGPRFSPPRLLRDMAAKGETFYAAA